MSDSDSDEFGELDFVSGASSNIKAAWKVATISTSSLPSSPTQGRDHAVKQDQIVIVYIATCKRGSYIKTRKILRVAI